MAVTDADDVPQWKFLPADEELAERVQYWQFAGARRLIRPDHPAGVAQVVRALAETFGDVDGGLIGGAMSVIIGAAVECVLTQLEQLRNDHVGPVPA